MMLSYASLCGRFLVWSQMRLDLEPLVGDGDETGSVFDPQDGTIARNVILRAVDRREPAREIGMLLPNNQR